MGSYNRRQVLRRGGALAAASLVALVSRPLGALASTPPCSPKTCPEGLCCEGRGRATTAGLAVATAVFTSVPANLSPATAGHGPARMPDDQDCCGQQQCCKADEVCCGRGSAFLTEAGPSAVERLD